MGCAITRCDCNVIQLWLSKWTSPMTTSRLNVETPYIWHQVKTYMKQMQVTVHTSQAPSLRQPTPEASPSPHCWHSDCSAAVGGRKSRMPGRCHCGHRSPCGVPARTSSVSDIDHRPCTLMQRIHLACLYSGAPFT